MEREGEGERGRERERRRARWSKMEQDGARQGGTGRDGDGQRDGEKGALLQVVY